MLTTAVVQAHTKVLHLKIAYNTKIVYCNLAYLYINHISSFHSPLQKCIKAMLIMKVRAKSGICNSACL